tara:strand:+ start:137 stop:853 length:717 start_codon:yes stop_codon:yes gene_type:complete
MSKYISLSKNDFYSLVIITPLFILYQILGFFNNYESHFIVKNSADVFIKNFFQSFDPLYGDFAYLICFIFIALFIVLKNRELFMSSEIKLLFLFGMLLESLIHSISLLVIMSLVYEILPLSISLFSNGIIEGVYLSIGAGIWEELLFRYVLITTLLFVFNKAMYDFSNFSYLVIIVVTSALFSYYHFLGIDPELISLSVFIYRFIAGIILAIIFIFRGLGIAAYTHTFYDLYLVFFRI